MAHARFSLIAAPWHHAPAGNRWVRVMYGWAFAELGSVWEDGRYLAAGGGRMGGRRIDGGLAGHSLRPTRGLHACARLCAALGGELVLERRARVPRRAPSAAIAKQVVDQHLTALGFELMAQPMVTVPDPDKLALLLELSRVMPPPRRDGGDLLEWHSALEEWSHELEALAGVLQARALVERPGVFQPAAATGSRRPPGPVVRSR